MLRRAGVAAGSNWHLWVRPLSPSILLKVVFLAFAAVMF